MYSQALVEHICERLADGESLRAICRDDDMPRLTTVFLWLDRHPEFVKQYERAREVQAETLAEEILEISDDGSADYVLRSVDGSYEIDVDKDHIQRSRLKVDARKWIASKLKPKVYGDSQRLELSGSINLTATPDEDLISELVELALEGRLGLSEGSEVTTLPEDPQSASTGLPEPSSGNEPWSEFS